MCCDGLALCLLFQAEGERWRDGEGGGGGSDCDQTSSHLSLTIRPLGVPDVSKASPSRLTERGKSPWLSGEKPNKATREVGAEISGGGGATRLGLYPTKRQTLN